MQSDKLEELIRNPASKDNIQSPSWLNKISKAEAEEYLINRIVDNLSALIPDAVVELTAECKLTEDKINQRKECKEAIERHKLEFTFQLENEKLPPFQPWVEFAPKVAGVGVAKLRFQYVAQPEVAANNVKVTLENGRLSEVSIESLETSIEMAMVVNEQPIKLGTIQETLSLNQKFRFREDAPGTQVSLRRN